MAWFRRQTEQEAAEAALMRTFYTAALAAAESYDVAKSRIEEGDLAALFDKLRASHLNFADDLKKRVKQLGADPEARAGAGEFGARLSTQINAAGTVRDLLIALRSGEENGVAMCREALENADLSRKSRKLLQSYMQAHINNIHDLSEQIAVRSGLAETTATFSAPQWLRYPKAGFWLLQGALIGLGYLFGRSRRDTHTQRRESPRAALAEQEAEAAREAGA